MEFKETRTVEMKLRATYTEDGKVEVRITARAPYKEAGFDRAATSTVRMDAPELVEPLKKILEKEGQIVAAQAILMADQAEHVARNHREPLIKKEGESDEG